MTQQLLNSAKTLEMSKKQHIASNPAVSVWVTASAGSGKTKILTDRVLRLLLSGALPERILCLTFTRAAASEMASRIAHRLSQWSLEDDEKLTADLMTLTGKSPSADELDCARKLFAAVLDAAGGLQVQTIHGFCQSILRRFPSEAGVSPQFDILDERVAKEHIRIARDLVIYEARQKDSGTITTALKELAGRVGEKNLTDLLDELLSERSKLRALLHVTGDHEGIKLYIRAQLGVEIEQTDRGLLEAAVDNFLDIELLRRAAKSLGNGTEMDRARGSSIQVWLDDAKNRVKGYPEYKSVFLTTSGEVRANLATKKVVEHDPAVLDILQTEADRLADLESSRRRLDLALRSESLVVLVKNILKFYEQNKINNSIIDYDDLILITRDLLQKPGIAPWVLFKLDGGVDHVLIDEAQDTNPEQWQVIEALTGEFFSEQGFSGSSRNYPRTVFAVGDIKQSIFSFQRADPKAFFKVRKQFSKKIATAGLRWQEVNLDISYRSSAAVLAAVDAVFNNDEGEQSAGYGLYEIDDLEKTVPIYHTPYRIGQEGLVELWEPEFQQEKKKREKWSLPCRQIEYDHPSRRLARKISTKISCWLHEGEILGSRGRPIRPGDIMILLRQRGQFVYELVKALKEESIPVAGVDRMMLTDQIAVMDLIAFGQFLLLPEDDLNLAVVLKSPLIGLHEDDLLQLCWNRANDCLWDELKSRTDSNRKLYAAEYKLSYWLSRVDVVAPYELFSEFLNKGGRRSLLERLGLEANDPIDEFLTQALEYERTHIPSLQGFLHWLTSADFEVKRDMDVHEFNQVRIMTIHGSKGLQAPIIFLPDTMTSPNQLQKIFWTESENGSEFPLWVPNERSNVDISQNIRNKELAKRDKEYRRLLYVAMTRAEDRLYIGGWAKRDAPKQSTWYQMIRAAFKPLAVSSEGKLVISARQVEAPDKVNTKYYDGSGPRKLPNWALCEARKETNSEEVLLPSDFYRNVSAILPFSDDRADGFERGKIIHYLLQMLPKIPFEDREQAAKCYLSRKVHGLTIDAQKDYLAAAVNLVNEPSFRGIFSQRAMVEVPICGEVELNGKTSVVSGRIDRLVVSDTEVILVDFKTNKVPPTDVEHLSQGHRKQMAIYNALVKNIYPDLPIRCLVVWTSGPKIMELPDSLLETSTIIV
ncbi:MAG: double-strand break repair helicase AddA [Rhodospirillaceae bacterium]|nr:double-strand break repair helicase AddA [Rhodospirillaceae bacterium]|tara:strand:+ start:1092 stop:4562 length:3471 start_codon:yes stop_codon:yes gene_type:complete